MTYEKITKHDTEDFSFDRSKLDAPAMFTPSISSIYVSMASGYKEKVSKERKIKTLYDDGRELNFLRHDSETFYHPYALTSAGHAHLDFEHKDVDLKEGIFHNRDRKNTLVIADSGGYQIGKGILKFDWDNFETSESNNKLRMKILRWMENVADVSMTLDVPVWGIGTIKGVDTFESCLNKTLFNHDYFIKNRTPGATRFLNVLHGRTPEEIDLWWNAVKDLPFEGWAAAGCGAGHLPTILKLLITMRDGNYLNAERNWMHYLGVGRFKTACIFTSIQKAIRKHIEPGFTISYDASSPFLSTVKGVVYSNLNYSPRKLSYENRALLDSKDMVDNDNPFPLVSPIGRKLKINDLCIRGHNYVPQKGQKQIVKSSLDALSYILVMNHNTYMHCKGIYEVNQFLNLPEKYATEYLPSDILEFNDLVDEYLTTSRPDALLRKHKRLIDQLSWRDVSKGNTIKNSNIFEVEGEDPLFNLSNSDDEHFCDDSVILDLE